MFLHIGGDVSIPVKSIIAIMDIDNTTVSADTREFLRIAEEEGFVIPINNELPKTFIITEQGKESRIYLTNISSVTLNRRVGYIERLRKEFIKKLRNDKKN